MNCRCPSNIWLALANCRCSRRTTITAQELVGVPWGFAWFSFSFSLHSSEQSVFSIHPHTSCYSYRTAWAISVKKWNLHFRGTCSWKACATCLLICYLCMENRSSLVLGAQVNSIPANNDVYVISNDSLFSQGIHASCSLTLCNVNNNWHQLSTLHRSPAKLCSFVNPAKICYLLFYFEGLILCFLMELLLTYFDMWLTCHPDLNSVTGICMCWHYQSINIERGNSVCILPINWIARSAVIKKKGN